ncbi:uncharacterized protein LOC120651318 isoform X5 [Panicum virgatum]|uniref:uncharacterized protein LOC120651318 isoform X5 n=1 Tax=Panicum virgatum TaxID=38727 RepID=UPI0019D53703|nr:uncharacterized protein LOC120651318 isoform X5 [Panicum virgatum]
MEGEPSLVSSQVRVHVHTGLTSGHVLPPDVADGDTTAALPITSDHTNQDINHATPMQLKQHMALESGIPIPVAQHNSHDDSFPRSDNHNIQDDKEIEDEPSPICSQVPINVTIDQLVPPIAAEGATGPDIAGIVGSHHNADAATSSYSVTIPTPGVVLDTDDLEPYQMEATHMATDDPLGHVLFHPCTQNEPIQRPSIVPRPQRLTKRPAMYVSPFKGDPQ